MKRKCFSIVLAALMMLVTVNAYALAPNYNSSITPDPATLNAGDLSLMLFAPAPGAFSSATLTLDIESLTNATTVAFSNGRPTKVSIPPSGYFVASDYMFTTDLKLGTNTFVLDEYLGNLNAASSFAGVGLFMGLDRGSVTMSSARLTGTVAPEPLSMALVGAGLAGLPLARRFRKKLQ